MMVLGGQDDDERGGTPASAPPIVEGVVEATGIDDGVAGSSVTFAGSPPAAPNGPTDVAAIAPTSQDEASSAPATESDTQKGKKRRRRLMEDLGFSSPGPAFLAMSAGSDAGSESDAAHAEGRAQRRHRVAAAGQEQHVSQMNGHVLSHTSTLATSPSPSAALQNGLTTSGSANASSSRVPSSKSVPVNGVRASHHHSTAKQINGIRVPSSTSKGKAKLAEKADRDGSQAVDSDEDVEQIDRPTSPPAARQQRKRRTSSRMHDYDERFSVRDSGSPVKLQRGSTAEQPPTPRHHRSVADQRRSPFKINGRSSSSTVTNGLQNDTERAQSAKLSPIERRRMDLLEARRQEIEEVYREHDGLVRELFHLRKFVTLFGFDPKVALKDRTDVFERFRMEGQFDLDTRLSGPNCRATRKLVSAKRDDLALPSREARASSSSTAKNADRNGKAEKASASGFASSSKAKPVAIQGKRGPGRPRKTVSPPARVTSAQQPQPQPKKRGRPSNAELEARKRQAARLLSSEGPEVSEDPSTSEDEGDESSAHEPQAKRRRGRPPNAVYLPKKPVDIERIDGIPRLHALRPANLPAASRHNRSLTNYLNSWFTTGDIVGGEWEIVTREALLAREEREVAVYRRIDELRGQGLLQSREDAAKRGQHIRAREAGRKPTAWDAILAGVGPRLAHQRAESRARAAAAKRVARLIETYWDEKLGRGEKHRKAEERRIRALAKWTVREVRKQWKLAVNVVRAQLVAREKQEKDRVGREQLRSILEQSTQVLGQQQKAMLELGARESDSESEESDIETSSDGEGSDDGDEEEENDLAVDASDEEMRDASDEEAEGGSEEDGESSDDPGFGSLSQLLLPRSPKEELATEDEVTTLSLSRRSASADVVLSGPDTPTGFDADTELRPVSSTPTPAIVNGDHPVITSVAEEEAADDDTEAALPQGTSDAVDEDAELERKMWEDDESESDNDAELAAEADMPIEELMKKYRYAEADTNEGALDDDEQSEEIEQSNRLQAILPEEDTSGHLDSLVADEEMDVSDEEPISSAVSLRPSKSRTAASTPVSDLSGIKVKPPFLLRGNLRPYQQIGFEWLVNLYNNGSNGILADEMGLGKTIQTIALLGHLACDRGVWGPHLVVAPTSVMLNWEVEFKKFLPGFKILSYYGSQRERKEKRKGWNTDNSFNVCITSYQLILADQHILRRKPWRYLVLDEAHHIKNFRSQRWQTLLGFNSQRRLLLTGTPLQNNLMDLWSLMYFLMPNGVTSAEGVVSSGFASMKEFQQWFSNPLDRAVENAGLGTVSEEMDTETKGMVSKLHTLLRPYLLRRLKSEVEKEMPNKYEHVIKCRLSKRQQFLYNDFMSRAKTRESLASGNYLSIINCLMQLRKVCNHPDLFEQRPIVTSFAMERSAVADYEIKELLVRRNLLRKEDEDGSDVNLDVLNLHVNSASRQHLTPMLTRSLRQLDASDRLPFASDPVAAPSAIDTWSIEGYAAGIAHRQHVWRAERWRHAAYLNRLRCQSSAPHLFDGDSLALVRSFGADRALHPYTTVCDDGRTFLQRCDAVHRMILGADDRREAVQGFIDRFAFVTPRAVSKDMPHWALEGLTRDSVPQEMLKERFDTLHAPAVKLQIAFPDASLLQYDCGKLQELAKLMQRCKYGTHRILIFTQMTKILDILEIWLSFNGFNYLRLDGQTKVEDRQSLTEKFNRDDRIKAFILSTRSGGLGINLTGADMVLFWDLDWNFQIEAQCMDRAHRIGQTRDVHIYRFVSEHTIEENMLKKSQEKRLLDAMVIQDGQFTTDGLSKMSWIESMFDEGSRSIAGVRVGGGGLGGGDETPTAVGSDHTETGKAAPNDRRIEIAMDAAEDEEDAQAAKVARAEIHVIDDEFADEMGTQTDANEQQQQQQPVEGSDPVAVIEKEEGVYPADNPTVPEEGVEEEEEWEGGTVDDYMLRRVELDWEHFSVW